MAHIAIALHEDGETVVLHIVEDNHIRHSVHLPSHIAAVVGHQLLDLVEIINYSPEEDEEIYGEGGTLQ